MSVIFFCADFSTFSYLKLASDSFGGVHKQCGLSKGRGRGCWAAYVIIQFDVMQCVKQRNKKNLKFILQIKIVPIKTCIYIRNTKDETGGKIIM